MLLDITLRNLWRRRLRSLLTVLGVAVALQLYLTMAGGLAIYERDLSRQLATIGGRLYVQQPMAREEENEGFPSFSSSMPGDVAEGVLALPGIDRSASSATLFVQLALPLIPDAPPAVLAVGIEPGHEAAFLGDLAAASGVASLPDAHSVVLGPIAADHYAPESDPTPVRPGDTVQILDRTFTVAGILEPASLLFDGAVLMDLATAQELFVRPEAASAVILTPVSLEEAASLRETIPTRFPDLRVEGQDEIAADLNQIIDNERYLFNGINGLVVAGTVIVVAIVMATTVTEQRREIGILRAIGARRATIFGLISGQSLAVSLAGAMAAWPVWGLVQATLMRSIPIPADVVAAHWLDMLIVAVVVGLAASLWPAWRAARVEPLEALAYE